MPFIDTTNYQLVGAHGKYIVVLMARGRMTADEAICHAAWLVALAQPQATIHFDEALKAVQNT